MNFHSRKFQLGLALIFALGLFLPMQKAGASVPNYTSWADLGIKYTAPSGNAYYPSVLYDANGFGSASPLYKMWYSDGDGQVFLVASTDGFTWGSPTTLTGLGGDAHHAQVLYDANCFGVTPCNNTVPQYKIWYWDINANLYSIGSIATAQSVDGIAWTDDTALSQDAGAPLITGAGVGWNRGSYGPASLLYQAGAGNTGTDPWNYSYVMYYEGTDGSSEVTGLGYSADGLDWTAFSASPVLDKGAGNAWDCDDAVYGTVTHDAAGFHYWYSGAGTDNGSGGCTTTDLVKGIGYASSPDGFTWTKASQPIFHVNQGVSYRSQRVYTPSVVNDGSGVLKMYYTAVGGDSIKKIGMAILTDGNVFVDDNWAGLANGTQVMVSGSPHFIGGDAFDTVQKGVNAVATGGVVTVAAGIYTEQVTISKDVHVIGAGAGSSIIKAPASLPDASQATSAIIIINGGNVELTGFTVSGPGPSACGSIRAGIFVRDNAHANIHDNTVQDIRDNPFGGCQNGIAIAVGRQAWATSGTADITNNTIVGYQKGGIVVDNTGSSANITGNTVTGAGTVNITAQNGIQISRGATATLTGNTITGNSYHNDANPSNWGATGILLYNAGNVTLAGGNEISGNDQNLDKTGSGLLTLGAETFGGSTAPAGTGFDIVNEDPQAIDATGVTFTGAADGFAIENRVYHKVDDVSHGLVTWDAGNVYATAESGSIQAAVDAASAGETVHVQAGNYVEAVTVDKPLTLSGPNANVNPNTGTRGQEAVLLPKTIGNDPYATCYAMLTIDSDNVTVKGFTLDGNNPDLTSGYLVNGVDVDACEGIVGFETVGSIDIENNIVKNTRYTGVDFDNNDGEATSGNFIRYNRLLNMGNDWGIGVLIYDNFYADVSYNFFDQVRVGVQTGNFYRSNPGSTASISQNNISSWRRGIFYNLHYSAASLFSVDANTIQVIDSTAAARWDGIMISSIQSAVNAYFTNNIITASDVQQLTVGYQVWNTPTTAILTVAGGSVTGADYGAWINNYQGYGPGNADNTAIALDNVSINGASIAGVFVQDDPLNTNGAHVMATINNSPIHGSTVGVLVQGSDASATGMCNQISSNTAGVNNATTAVLNFEKNWWGSATGPAGVGVGLGDSVSANVDYMPWNTDTTCTAFTSNNKPTANSLSVSTDKNTAKAITLTGSDLEGSPLTFSVVHNPAHGSLSGTLPSLTYTPTTNFTGGDSFTFTAFDGIDYSAEATISITVNAVNSDPVITETSPVEVSMAMNSFPHPFQLTLNATDVDTSDTLTWSIDTNGAHGTASVTGDGTGASMVIHYTPAHNFAGKDTFIVQVADGNGGFDTVIVHVTINLTYSLPIIFVPSVP